MTPQDINLQIAAIDKALASQYTPEGLKDKLQAKKKELQALTVEVKEIKQKEKKVKNPALKPAIKTEKTKVAKKSAAIKTEVKELLAEVKQKIAEFNKGRSKSSIAKDAQTKANAPGKHTSASGKTYYEHRPDHTDISPEDRLESGGTVKLKITKPEKLWVMVAIGLLSYYSKTFKESQNGYIGTQKVINDLSENPANHQYLINAILSLKAADDAKPDQLTKSTIGYLEEMAEKYATDNTRMAKGGRIKSALMRDRKYTSQQEHEKNYKRRSYHYYKAEGGVIDTEYYEDNTAAELWGGWTKEQRKHFLLDHFEDEFASKSPDELDEVCNKPYADLWEETQAAIEMHRKQGQYAKGGVINKNVYLAKYRNKYVVVSADGENKNMRWANELFTEKQEALQFISDNALNLISETIGNIDKEATDKNWGLPTFTLGDDSYEAGGEVDDIFRFTESDKYPGQYVLGGADDGESPLFTKKETDLIKEGYQIDMEMRASRTSKEKMKEYQKEKKYPTILEFSENEFGGNWRLWKKENAGNILVFGYETQFFNECPEAAAAITAAAAKIAKESKGKNYVQHYSALVALTEVLDTLFAEKANISELGIKSFTGKRIASITQNLLLAGVYNYKAGSVVNMSFLNNCMEQLIKDFLFF